MAHDHHHPHHGESASNYFTEQLLTILVCGLIGFAAIQMYRTNKLEFLTEPFRAPVLYGGIGILGLVVLRSIAVWKEAGEMQAHMHDHPHDHDHAHHHAHDHAHGHDHVHGPDCDHDHSDGHVDPLAHPDAHVHHAEEDHDHGHSHDMSWTFARMLILIFPVLLYFLGLPHAVFSKERQLKMLGNESAVGTELLKEQIAKGYEEIEPVKEVNGAKVRILKTMSGLKIRETVAADGEEPKYELISEGGREMRFNELNDAALDEGKRKYMEGETAILEGRFKRLADKEFSLFRMKMTCCASDTVPLKVRIIVPQALSGYEDFQWVRVKGQVQFLQVPGQNRHIPVLMVADIRDVSKELVKNEYEQ